MNFSIETKQNWHTRDEFVILSFYKSWLICIKTRVLHKYYLCSPPIHTHTQWSSTCTFFINKNDKVFISSGICLFMNCLQFTVSVYLVIVWKNLHCRHQFSDYCKIKIKTSKLILEPNYIWWKPDFVFPCLHRPNIVKLDCIFSKFEILSHPFHLPKWNVEVIVELLIKQFCFKM